MQLSACDRVRLSEQVLALAVGLEGAGVDVSVAGPIGGSLRVRLSRAGLPWVWVPFPEEGEDPRAAVAALTKLLASGAPAVLHAHGLPALRLAIAARARLAPSRRSALVATLYETPPQLTGLAQWRATPRLRAWLREAVAVLVPSPAHREALVNLVGPVAQGAEVVHPLLVARSSLSGAEAGFRRHRLGISGHAAIIGLSTGFSGPEPSTFLRAATRVLDALGNVEFVLIGEGPGLEAARRQAHDLGLGGASTFITAPPSLPEVLSVLNLLVVLDDAGAAHMDALQALRFGVPLITAPLPSLAEVLPSFPETRVLEEISARQVAEAIQSALHVLPDAPGAPGSGEIESTLSLTQYLGLDTNWNVIPTAESGRARPAAGNAASLALGDYSTEAVVAQVCELYQRVAGD